MNDDPASAYAPLHAFEGVGIELEFMIVDSVHLNVQPLAERLLQGEDGKPCNDVSRGAFGWSNELVAHVLEVKNLRPHPSLDNLPQAFHGEVKELNRRLAGEGAQLMPTAMHPWMDPQSQTHLWSHGSQAIYRAYDRIFNCRDHGWANLQSMHINLPFADDVEFARMHAAIRLVLPILPALAASSPIAGRTRAGWMDTRMRVYCDNAPGFPAITGMVIPETITSRAAYEQRILEPMYQSIAPHDPDKLLQHEWLNSRGAIARFDRHAIEMRVVDTQECPRADLAVAAAACATVRALYQQHWMGLEQQQEMPTAALAVILQDCIRDAERTFIRDADYLRLLGFPGRCCTAGELWWHLVEHMHKEPGTGRAFWQQPLRVILQYGTLARRIVRAAGKDLRELEAVYRELCACLAADKLFAP